jgi:enoyl-CoA hydratase/carnithine racemase
VTGPTPQPVVLYEIREPGLALITLNRPDRLNALNMDVKRRLEARFKEASADPAVRVVVLTGAGGAFVAGTDIAEMRDMTPASHAELGTNYVFLAQRACTKPMIAAVEGYALGGGCELALGCDMIVAGEGAQFGQPEIRVGIMPGAGGTQLLLRTVGRYRAMKLCLTGERISAADAAAMGLLSDLVPEGEALAKALALAELICGMPPLAVAGVKRAIRVGQEVPLSDALSEERGIFEALFASADQKEGMSAFLEKRRARYVGA